MNKVSLEPRLKSRSVSRNNKRVERSKSQKSKKGVFEKKSTIQFISGGDKRQAQKEPLTMLEKLKLKLRKKKGF